jgi:protein translocase SecG subunit
MNQSLLNGLMITEIVASILLVVSILLQPGDEGVGSFLGGGGGESFRTRRGLEKFLYYATIVLAVIFAVLSFIIVKYTS